MAELEAEPGSPVFFHDYHLYLAPRFVRTRVPDAALSHFVHIPWPEPDYWRVLPEAIRRALHDGLLANDVVGFHTDRWRRNFLRSCADILGAECDFVDGTAEYDDRSDSRDQPSDLRRPGRVRRARRQRRGSRARGGARRRAARSGSSSGSTGPTRRRTSSAASGRSSGS